MASNAEGFASQATSNNTRAGIPNPTPGLYIDSAGNVGIGTPTPSETLEVAGNVRADAVTSQQIITKNLNNMALSSEYEANKPPGSTGTFPMKMVPVKDGNNFYSLCFLTLTLVHENSSNTWPVCSISLSPDKGTWVLSAGSSVNGDEVTCRARCLQGLPLSGAPQ